MAVDTNQIAVDTKQHAHELVEQLDPNQLAAVVQLLEVMLPRDEQDELTEEDRLAIRSSREYFRENPRGGVSFEEMVAGCGFTLNQATPNTNRYRSWLRLVR